MFDTKKAVARIKRTTWTNKNSVYVSYSHEERAEILKHIVLNLAPGAYVLSGDFGRSLKQAVNEIAGVYAELDVDQKFLRGLAVEHEKKIQTSFTLGLKEIIITNARKY